MPVPQLTPPGHLDQHSLLVALTPVLLCLVMAGAARLIGERTGLESRGSRTVRVLAALNVAGALMLQALFLLPWGPAAAYTEPLAGGLVRVGWFETGAAFIMGCWATWYWRPWKPGVVGGSARWCLRIALALALPVVALPILVIPALADVRVAETQAERGRLCWIAAVIAVIATAVILTWPGLPPDRIWSIHGGVFLVSVCVLLYGPWPWRIPFIVAFIGTMRAW